MTRNVSSGTLNPTILYHLGPVLFVTYTYPLGKSYFIV